MNVAVIICAYSPDRWDALCESVISVLEQSYQGEVQTIVVIDGNEELCELATQKYGSHPKVTVYCNSENVGVSVSRNNGLEQVSSDVDIVAFLDDDAVATTNWISELVSTYEAADALAVGGPINAEWITEEPDFLPQEFYWLFGVTPPDFASPGEEIRNTFASNISFRRSVIESLGGFASSIGRFDDENLQAEEPELGARLRARYDRGVVYNPNAIVRHKIFDYRTNPRWLLDRAFWQGYSKRAIETITESTEKDTESRFLRNLLVKSIPARLIATVRSRTTTPLLQLFWLLLLTATVGVGYLYGFTKYPPSPNHSK